jgi:hypothetical protein
MYFCTAMCQRAAARAMFRKIISIRPSSNSRCCNLKFHLRRLAAPSKIRPQLVDAALINMLRQRVEDYAPSLPDT